MKENPNELEKSILIFDETRRNCAENLKLFAPYYFLFCSVRFHGLPDFGLGSQRIETLY